MPFKSERQRRYLYAKHPQMARRWSAEEKAVSKMDPRYGAGSGAHGSRIVEKRELTAAQRSNRNRSARNAAIGGGVGAAATHGALVTGLAAPAMWRASAHHPNLAGSIPKRVAASGAATAVMPFHPTMLRAIGRNPRALGIIGSGALAGATVGAIKPKNKKRKRPVQKGVGSFLRATGGELKHTFRPFSPQARSAAAGKSNPRTSMFQNRVAETVRQRPRSATIVGGSTVAGAYGLGTLNKSEVSKARRTYDPEHRRQRRLGIYEAGLVGGGGTAAGFGVHGIRRDTKEMAGEKMRTWVINDQNKRVPGPDAKIGDHLGRGAVRLRRKPTLLLAGGLTALGGAGMVRHHAESTRGRPRV